MTSLHVSAAVVAMVTLPQAIGVDKEGKKVKFSDGEDIGYDKLLLATGSKLVL